MVLDLELGGQKVREEKRLYLPVPHQKAHGFNPIPRAATIWPCTVLQVAVREHIQGREGLGSVQLGVCSAPLHVLVGPQRMSVAFKGLPRAKSPF
jgi:hypothetical protein